MKTTNDFVVMGLQKAYNIKDFEFKGWSGRVRVVVGNPFHDEYMKWDDHGKAVDHEYGDIDISKVRR